MAVRQDKVQIQIEFITDESKAFAKTLIDTKEMNKQLAESRAKLAQYNQKLLEVGADEVKRATILAKIAVEENRIQAVLGQIADEAKKVAAIDLSRLTPAQLTERAKQLAAAMRDIPQSAPAFRELEAELARVNEQLGVLRANAKGIQDAGPEESGGGFFGSVAGKVTVAIAAAQAFFATLQGIFNFARTAVAEFRAGAAADAALASRIQSTEGAAGRSVEQLVEQAAELQKVTFFTDDQTKKGQEILLTFTNIRGEIFDRTIPAAQDLSTVFGQDLQASAVQLGKALNDPVQGITALRRVGISFSEDQRSMIERLVKTNQVAEAQALILEEVERQVGGAARAAAEAEGGPYLLLQQRLGEVQEGFGQLISGGLDRMQPMFEAVTTVLEKMVESLLSGEKATGEYADTANSVIGVLEGLAGMVTFVSSVFDVLYKVVLQPLGFLISNIIIPAIVGIGIAMGALPRFISENRVAIGLLVVGLVTLNAQLIASAANSLRMAVVSAATTVATNAQSVAQRLLNAAMAANPIGLVITALAALVAIFTSAYNGSEKFRASFEGFAKAGIEIFKILIESAQAFARGFSQLLDGEFSEAGKSFAEGITKSNPIGIAFTQGERLGKAYSEGYASGLEKAPPDPRDLAEQARDDRQRTFRPARPKSPGENDFSVGGPPLEDAAARRKKALDADLKEVEAAALRREVVLENFRIKEEIDETRHQEGLLAIKKRQLKEQLDVYKKFKQEGSVEALKIQNELLKLESEGEEDIQTKAIQQEITNREQKYIKLQTLLEGERLRDEVNEADYQDRILLLKKLKFEEQLSVYREFGQDQTTEALKLANEIVRIEREIKDKTQEQQLRIRLETVQADNDVLLAGLREKFAAALIAEQDYELLRLEAKRLALKAELAILRESAPGQVEEIRKREDAKAKIEDDIAKKRLENQKRTEELRRQIENASIKATQDVFQVAADLLGADEKQRKKNAVAIKAFQSAQVITNSVLEVQKIWASVAEFGPAGPIIGGVLTAVAVARTGLALKKIQDTKFAGGGYTGAGIGGRDQTGFKPAGIVHEGEYVVPKWIVDNPSMAPVVHFLETHRLRGFADGGFAGMNTTPNSASLPSTTSSQRVSIEQVEMLDAAVKRFERVVAAFPKEVKSRVVYQDLEDAGTELNSVRDDAAL